MWTSTIIGCVSVAAFVGCQDVKEIGGGVGLDLSFLPHIGRVYECDFEDGTMLELCYKDGPAELEASLAEHGEFAACDVTDRHLGPCYYHCGSGRGCNAFHGCWCP